ncbi:MAG: hypothetical protein AAFY38_10415 [Pseudomonadota bacterium]
MNKLVEPTTQPRMTSEDEARMVARAQAGLADVAAGRTLSVEEALAQIEATPVNTRVAD